MKAETLIYDKVKLIIPDNSDKTVFFAAISNTSHEVFFYSYIGGTPIQCFSLAEEGILEENELDRTFEEIVKIIKNSKVYSENKLNVATITLEKAGIKMSMDYYENDARLYKIKKDWMQTCL